MMESLSSPPFSVTTLKALQSDLFTLTLPCVHLSTPLPFAILFYNFRIIINMVDVHINIVIITLIIYYWFILETIVVITKIVITIRRVIYENDCYLLLLYFLCRECQWLAIMSECQTKKIRILMRWISIKNLLRMKKSLA